MEKLQGPMNSCYIGEHLDVNLLECCSLGQGFVSTQEEGDNYYSSSSHFSSANSLLLEEDNKMPFLQMLQSVELQPFFPLKEPSFQALLKLQHIKSPCFGDNTFKPSSIIDPPLQYYSSSPVKSEIVDLQNPQCIGPSVSQDQAPNLLQDPSHCTDGAHPPAPPVSITREKRKRKRKRTKPTMNKEEVESQRLNHIAVERNRRRLTNEHLSSLRALMPPSYVQRGDQASIVGGAIDFVKELEQLVQSLEAQKRIRRTEEAAVSHFCHVNSQMPVNGHERGGGVHVRQRSEVAEIEVTVIQNHVNLKVNCPMRPSQLVRAVVALEELRLTVLHLNITTSYTRVLYTFNLKMEEECKLGSAVELAGAVHQIFSIINGS